jgi:hypothetical protein
MLWHPEKLTITESNPGTISGYQIVVKKDQTNEVLATQTYPSAGSVTEIPIGSNGLFDSLESGINIRLFVTELYGAETGPEQQTDVYTLLNRPDGAENIIVTY